MGIAIEVLRCPDPVEIEFPRHHFVPEPLKRPITIIESEDAHNLVGKLQGDAEEFFQGEGEEKDSKPPFFRRMIMTHRLPYTGKLVRVEPGVNPVDF